MHFSGNRGLMIQRIKEAQPQTHLTSTFLGCLTAMTNGDLTVVSGEHWANALKAGGITATVASVIAAVGLRVNRWTRALLCGATTFGIETLSRSPTYGTTMSDIVQTAVIAGSIATVLAFVTGGMFEKALRSNA